MKILKWVSVSEAISSVSFRIKWHNAIHLNIIFGC